MCGRPPGGRTAAPDDERLAPRETVEAFPANNESRHTKCILVARHTGAPDTTDGGET